MVTNILCLILVIGHTVTAQSPPGTPNIIPPSPTVAALTKYGEIPISYATGIPQVKIPIHTIKGRELTLPIELSYHGGGMKVGEKPGWLGLSWSLPGANNVISRTIRGLPDSDAKGYNANYSLVNQTTINETLQDQILQRDVDAEPDEYSYNIVGRGGKLLVLNDKIVTVPYQNIDIGIGENDATIVTEDGTRYAFGATEKYQSEELIQYTQTWYLTAIANANETEIITFEYSEPFLVTEPIDAWMTTVYQDMSIGNGCPIKDPVIVNLNQDRFETRLEKITFEDTEIFFNGRDLLNSIVIFEKGVKLKTFTLEYDSYHMLSQVTEEAVGSSDVLKHKMTYQAPSTSRFARDHWGYPNGAYSNAHLFPYSANALPPATRAASAKSGVQTSGALMTITYPTGGYTAFEYETNTYWNGGGPDIITYGQKYVPVFAAWNDEMPNSPIEASVSFTISGETQPVTYDVTGYFNNGEGEGMMVDVEQLMTFELYKVGVVTPLVSFNIPNTDLAYSLHPQFKNLAEGEYEARVKLTPPPSPTPLITDMSIHVGISYVERAITPAETGTTVGGIRIKKITTSDGMGVSPDQVRTFQYTRQHETGVGLQTVSSGFLTLMPEYTYQYLETLPSPVNPVDLRECIRRIVSNGEEAIAGMGPTVYYSEVTELIGSNGEFGKTVYYFEPPTRTASAYPYPQIQTDYRAGLPAGVKKYKRVDNGYEIVSESFTQYQFHEDIEDPHRHSLQGIKVLVSAYYVGVSGADPVESYAQTYRLGTAWFHTKRQIEISHNNGEQFIDTTYHFYDNPDHCQLTKTERANSDGSVTVQEMTYPDDYTGSNPDLAAMKNLYLKNRAITQYTKRRRNDTTTVTSAIVNRFERNGTSQVVLKEVYALKSNTPVPQALLTVDPAAPFFVNSTYLERKISFNAFDDHANILSYAAEKNLTTSFIWDCDKRRPIAQVVDASNTNISFTGFECATNGGWTVTGGSVITTDGNFKTGQRAWEGGQITKTLTTGNYSVSLWAKGSGNISVNGAAKAVASTWTLLKWDISNSGSITIITNGNIVDEVRLLPKGAQMTTYTYDTGGRVTSVADPNNTHTFYEYDEFKRLRAIKNHRGEILNYYEYHYRQN